MDRRRLAFLLLAAAAVIAVLGFLELRFLTDDAYISFRYASNALVGRGLVWNPAPFLPVEGYTNFAWVLLLGAVWAGLGVEPPRAADALSLAFGLGTLVLMLRIGLRLQMPARWERWRLALLAIAMLGVVTNHTFLTWLSSGLETAMFNFAWTAWIAYALIPPTTRSPRATLALTGAAALAALTRPDGWLAVAGCAPLGLWAWRAHEPGRANTPWAWSPLLLPPLHLLWRRGYYGEWLPNTWYAKHVGAWPQSGIRYAASFALEYGLWLWLGIAVLWLLRRPRPTKQTALVVAVVIAHFAYYTLAIGGDHFEYRVYSHLVPLIFLSAVGMLASADVRPVLGAAWLGVLVAMSWPIPWTHHLLTRDLATRAETHELVEPVAPHLPVPLRWLASPFDRLQAWLIPRHVGMRRREHAVFHEQLVATLPPRSEGERIPWDEHAVLLSGNVGVVGWVFPNVAILDVLGLNDYVVARTPVPAGQERRMAHERLARPDYLACYRPNFVVLPAGAYELREREAPLTDADIATCEIHWRARAGEPIVVPEGMEIRRQ